MKSLSSSKMGSSHPIDFHPIVPKSKADSALNFSSTRDLPNGWERKLTADGRTYFVDHNNKQTYWSLPESIQLSVTGASTQAARLSVSRSVKSQEHVPGFSLPGFTPLPPIAELQPIAQQQRTENTGSLPEFWEAKVTAEGQPYYVNHKDKTTHWTLP